MNLIVTNSLLFLQIYGNYKYITKVSCIFKEKISLRACLGFVYYSCIQNMWLNMLYNEIHKTVPDYLLVSFDYLFSCQHR